MQPRLITLVVLVIVFLLVDFYLFQAVVQTTRQLAATWRTAWRVAYWLPTVFAFAVLVYWTFGDPYNVTTTVRNWVASVLVAIYISKFIGIFFLILDDIGRFFRWAVKFFYKGASESLPGEAITRSEFLSRAALVATAVPFGTMAYGIISGAHDYRIKRLTLRLPHLPKAFDGIRLAQISDIHSGSFWNKAAVQGGVEMIMREKPDIIAFTGDLVNNQTDEVNAYVTIFDKLKAPLGVFSITGNHDYGDYRSWNTREEKRQNFADLVEAHRLLGYDLLMNEHRTITLKGESISIIGIENWGVGRFSKYGQLDKAYAGVQAPVKILLSHDPSHWDAQVRKEYPDIDLMLAGHTHGFQFGVEVGNFKWSPSQYAYKQWAGLYTEGQQHLYVNRGFGYIGYPGRIGMPPEITIIELKSA